MFTNAVIEPAMVEKLAGLAVDPLRYGQRSFNQIIETLESGIGSGPWIMGERFTAADVLLGSSTHFLETSAFYPKPRHSKPTPNAAGLAPPSRPHSPLMPIADTVL